MTEATSSQSPWITETTDATFAEDVIQRSREVPVVVDFWSLSCPPCRALEPVLTALAVQYDGAFVLVKAEAEKTQSAAMQYGVQALPTVYGFRDGQPVDFFMGALEDSKIQEWLTRLLPSAAEQSIVEAKALESSSAEEAKLKYRQAISLDEGMAEAKIGLAGLLLKTGNVDESRQWIDQLQQRGYLEPAAEKVKAQLDLQAKGIEAGGVEQCRAAAAAAPDDGQLKLKLTEALAAAGEHEEALQIALDLVQTDKQQFGDAARQIMVDIFQLQPDDSELTSLYRRKLSMALY
ncbi:MAG: tetratricopeptide repeat protein [Planctomycetales bacterium]